MFNWVLQQNLDKNCFVQPWTRNITLSCLVLVSASEVEESNVNESYTLNEDGSFSFFFFFFVADKVHKTKYDVSDEGQSNLKPLSV